MTGTTYFKNSFLLLTLPSKTAQRIANNYSFVIAELPIELEKDKQN